MTKQRIAIFDLDGCLFDDEHRQHLIDWDKRDFAAYHAAMNHDDEIPVGIAALEFEIKKGAEIMFSTARPENVRKQSILQISLAIASLYNKMGATGKKSIDFDEGIKQFFSQEGGLNVVDYESIHNKLLMRSEEKEGIPSAILKTEAFGEWFHQFLCQEEIATKNVEVHVYDDHVDVIRAFFNRTKEFGNIFVHGNLLSKSMLIPFYKSLFKPANEPQVSALANEDLLCIEKEFGNIACVVFKERIHNNAKLHTSALDCSISTFAGYVGAGFITDTMARETTVFVPSHAHKKDVDEKTVKQMVELMNNPVLGSSPQEIRDMLMESQRQEMGDDKPTKQLVPESPLMSLQAAMDIMRERNANYKDNHVVVAAVMKALFPKGIVLETSEDFQFWHLFELLIVKLTRYTNSDLKHRDSIQDLINYAAMVDSLTDNHNIKVNK